MKKFLRFLKKMPSPPHNVYFHYIDNTYYNSRSTSVANFTDKNILNRTLEDSGFWYRNAALKQQERIVWLLLYYMQGRKFTHRYGGSTCKTREKIFEVCCNYIIPFVSFSLLIFYLLTHLDVICIFQYVIQYVLQFVKKTFIL